jgi:hypothetical protein
MKTIRSVSGLLSVVAIAIFTIAAATLLLYIGEKGVGNSSFLSTTQRDLQYRTDSQQSPSIPRSTEIADFSNFGKGSEFYPQNLLRKFKASDADLDAWLSEVYHQEAPSNNPLQLEQSVDKLNVILSKTPISPKDLLELGNALYDEPQQRFHDLGARVLLAVLDKWTSATSLETADIERLWKLAGPLGSEYRWTDLERLYSILVRVEPVNATRAYRARLKLADAQWLARHYSAAFDTMKTLKQDIELGKYVDANLKDVGEQMWAICHSSQRYSDGITYIRELRSLSMLQHPDKYSDRLTIMLIRDLVDVDDIGPAKEEFLQWRLNQPRDSKAIPQLEEYISNRQATPR